MDVKLPQLAEGVEGGTVVSILVAEGQAIKKDQPFMELETQKAVGSIPAPQSGVVTKIHVKQGMEVSVGMVLISIDTANSGSTAPNETTSKPPTAVAPTSQAPSGANAGNDDYLYQSKSGMPPPAAPSIRKLARELDIDLTRIRGSEAGGRTVLADLRDYIKKLQQRAFQGGGASAPGSVLIKPATAAEAPNAVDFAKWGPIR
ncbi:MAG TPA: biotin/lipoyl-containing protein, partial [Candidatus Binatia bacterium]